MVLDTVATETFARSATVRMSIKPYLAPFVRLDFGIVLFGWRECVFRIWAIRENINFKELILVGKGRGNYFDFVWERFTPIYSLSVGSQIGSHRRNGGVLPWSAPLLVKRLLVHDVQYGEYHEPWRSSGNCQCESWLPRPAIRQISETNKQRGHEFPCGFNHFY
jgi:hypothetical protein